jgi:CRP-like cAMP-binding protein
LPSPEPSIVTYAFEESGIKYWLRYFIADMGRRDGIDGGVRDRVWYALTRAGIPITVPVRKVELIEIDEARETQQRTVAAQRRLDALQGIELFSGLGADDIELLASNTTEALYGAGEVVIRQGDPGKEMYIVEEGELAIRLQGERSDKEAARIKEGSFFGEMSLLTGDARSTTVVALTRCRLLVIGHESFRAVLERHPIVAKTVAEKLAERRQSLDALAALPSSIPNAPVEDSNDLVARIRRFFNLEG